MLSVVEALKEFCTIILGYPIMVYTDHKNLTHGTDKHANACIMRWRLTIEEFSPNIKYTPGSTNAVADVLSRLELSFQQCFEYELNYLAKEEEMMDQQPIDDVPLRDFNIPVNFKKIHREQQKDKESLKLRRETPHRLGTLFDRQVDKDRVFEVTTIKDPITKTERIIVPATLKKGLLQ